MPPHRSGAWAPVEKLVDTDVAVVGPVGGLRVELVDRRLWTELVSLTPAEAVQLADQLRDAAIAAAERVT